MAYEVILAIQSLINKHGKDLHEAAWDLIFKIMLTVTKQLCKKHVLFNQYFT